jgi:general L-amino acid transport system permease protein
MSGADEPAIRVDDEATASVATTVTGDVAVTGDAVERPSVKLPPREWARQNLFSGPLNTALTVLLGVALAYATFRLVRFGLVTADWEIVRRNLLNFMVGFDFPRSEVWRVWAAVYLLVVAIGFVAGVAGRAAAELARTQGRSLPRATPVDVLRRYWPLLAFGVLCLSFTRTISPTLLVVGAVATSWAARAMGRRLRSGARMTWPIGVAAVLGSIAVVGRFGGVSWDDWGGLHLTLFVTVAGIAFATPIGIGAALARRSSLPALRWVTVASIELLRGAPLVVLLFMGQFVVPRFFPNTVEPPSRLARALIIVVLFEAAYIAEAVRGGLQAVPRGQYEAATALGLRPWTATRRIVLPQALRNVLPAMVGQFISLFKDTSLLAVLGFTEFLEVVNVSVNQREFLGQGLHTVGFAFVALGYWAVSYTMSRESRRLERRLGIGER